MTGYDLKLWRKSLGWSRDRAAEELGVCLRAYKDYENTAQVKRAIALATVALSLDDMLPLFRNNKINKTRVLDMLQTITAEAMNRK